MQIFVCTLLLKNNLEIGYQYPVISVYGILLHLEVCNFWEKLRKLDFEQVKRTTYWPLNPVKQNIVFSTLEKSPCSNLTSLPSLADFLIARDPVYLQCKFHVIPMLVY